jgi:hypothetical protein
MPTKYYKVHGGKLSFAEYWRMCPDPITFTIAAIAKVFFGGLPLGASIPRHEELHLVDYATLPKGIRKAIAEAVAGYKDAGLERVFCYELDVLESHRYGVGTVFLAPDGRSFAVVNFAREGEKETVELNVVSPFKGDGFGVTSTGKKQFKPQPDSVYDRHPGMAADELYETHQENLEKWERKGYEFRKVTKESLPGYILEGEQGFIDFHAERGVFVPMSKAEVRELKEERAEAERLNEDDEE